MYWLDIATSVLHIVILPVIWCLQIILYILHWLVFPFLVIGQLIKQSVLLPAQFLAQLEVSRMVARNQSSMLTLTKALWYFLGGAVLIGTTAGFCIYGIMRIFTSAFDLDRKPVPQPVPARGHDAASYRAARAEKRQQQHQKEERQAIRAKLLASQPLIQEVVREARSRPIALSSPLSPNTGTAATRSGLFQDIILEQTDESEDSFI